MVVVPPPIAVITPFPTEAILISSVIYSTLEVISNVILPSLPSYS